MNQTDKYISYLEAEIQYLKKLLDDNGISYDYEAHLRALQSDVGDIIWYGSKNGFLVDVTHLRHINAYASYDMAGFEYRCRDPYDAIGVVVNLMTDYPYCCQLIDQFPLRVVRFMDFRPFVLGRQSQTYETFFQMGRSVIGYDDSSGVCGIY